MITTMTMKSRSAVKCQPGAYEFVSGAEQYGVRDHHYAIVNRRAVIFHPETRRVIHVYD